MKHSVVFPLVSHPYNPELVTPEAVVRFARAAEAAGFAGIAFTDHPAPSDKWLKAGGHDALDPFTALAFIAGVTKEIRLIPHIVVLPYRNPFVVAKTTATLDILSGGRFVLSVASGYLRSEYRALGWISSGATFSSTKRCRCCGASGQMTGSTSRARATKRSRSRPIPSPATSRSGSAGTAL